jgi:hypothetical protein
MVKIFRCEKLFHLVSRRPREKVEANRNKRRNEPNSTFPLPWKPRERRKLIIIIKVRNHSHSKHFSGSRKQIRK